MLRSRKNYDDLADVPFFGGWSKDELAHLDRVGERVTYTPGEALITEDRTGYEFIVILEGEVDVLVAGERLAGLGPGDHVGEMALLDHARTNATVVATTPVRALLVASSHFRALLDTVPSLDRKLLTSLTRRLREQSS